MSSNNLVWCMSYKGKYHVFYSGCADNTPKEPDYTDKHYKEFEYRRNALVYAHNVVNRIGEEAYCQGFSGVEYGVCEITIEEPLFSIEKIFHIDKIIEEWEQKIKDLQFSVEVFELWKKKLLKGQPKCVI